MDWSCNAVLFDMDGTLVDSKVSIERVWRRFAERHSIPFHKVDDLLPGRTATEILAGLGMEDPSEIIRLSEEQQEDMSGITPIAGARAFIDSLPRTAWAIVTAAPKAVALARLKAAGLPEPSVLVAAESVPRSKPHPDGFLFAAKRLIQDIHACTVFEDSLAGVQSAQAAEAKIITIGQIRVDGVTAIEDFTEIISPHSGSDGILRWSVKSSG